MRIVVEAPEPRGRRLRVGPAELAEVAPMANQRQLDVDRRRRSPTRGRRGDDRVRWRCPSDLPRLSAPTIVDRCTEEHGRGRRRRRSVRSSRSSGSTGPRRRSGQTNWPRYGLGVDLDAPTSRAPSASPSGSTSESSPSTTTRSPAPLPALPWSGTRETGLRRRERARSRSPPSCPPAGDDHGRGDARRSRSDAPTTRACASSSATSSPTRRSSGCCGRGSLRFS